jgi:hypothetical protein
LLVDVKVRLGLLSFERSEMILNSVL